MSCSIDGIDYEDNLQAATIYIDNLDCAKDKPFEVKCLLYKYWATHLTFIMNPTFYIEKIKFVNDEKTYKLPELGSGYMGSPYGQLVNEILGGCLEKNKKSKTSFTFSGTSF